MKKLSLAALLALSLTACSDDPEATADVEACEHLEGNTGTAVTASTSAAGAPAVGNDHKRYDIDLVDVAGGKGGAVSFAVAEATDYILFLDAAVPVAVTGAGGTPVAHEEAATSSAECAAVKGRHVYPLAVGTYTLTFGPATATRVGLVIEEAAHADE